MAAWLLPPNWRDAVEITSAYKTDIFTARSGREQRRALRGQPRRQLSIPVTVSESQMRTFMRSLQTGQNQITLIGDPVRHARLAAPVAADAVAIELTEIPAWVVADAVLVLESAERADLITVDSIDENTVTLASATPYAWPANARVRPTLAGQLSAEVQARNPTSRVIEAVIQFDVDPGSDDEPTRDPGLWVHDGREVFTKKPNWGDEIGTEFRWPVERVDFGHGRVGTYRPIDFGTMLRQATYVGQGATEVAEIESFFDRMYGRRGEFHMSTGLADMVMAANATEGTATLRVTGTEIHAAYADDPVYRAVCVQMRDGRKIFRTISGMATDAGDTVLTMTENWLSDIPASQVAMVSWMPVFRFGSDELTFEWLTSEVAQTQIAMQSLEHLDAENGVPAYDGAAKWVLEVWGERGIGVLDSLEFAVHGAYPAVFWWPLAWAWTYGAALDDLDTLINETLP